MVFRLVLRMLMSDREVRAVVDTTMGQKTPPLRQAAGADSLRLDVAPLPQQFPMGEYKQSSAVLLLTHHFPIDLPGLLTVSRSV